MFAYDGAGRTLTRSQDSDFLTTVLSLDWDHESELAATSLATTVYPEPEPGSGDDDSDGDQSGGTAPDRGTGTTTTATGRNLYTADGDRIVRTAPDGSITVYLGGQEITKAPDGSVTAARYYSFAGQTVAMRTANGLGGVTSLINDPHGTALASVHNTNWTTTSVAKHYTLPFGAQRGGVSAPGDHEFLGKVRDEATGLTLVGARWYDETIGRFLTVDPVMDLTDPEQWNGYSYGNNNPTTNWDPDGLEPRPWHESGVGFSAPKSQAYLRSEGTNGAGWTSGWGTRTYSGPLTVSSGVPVIVDGATLHLSSTVQTDSGYERPKHSVGYQILSSVYAPETKKALDNASWFTPFADAAQLGLYLACLQEECGAYDDMDNVDAGLIVVGFAPAGDIFRRSDDVVGAASAVNRSADDLAEGAGAACRRNSFDAGTLVLMADGTREPIEDVGLGDEVIATDPENGERGPRKVIDLIRHGGAHTMVDVELSDGSQVDATDEHPFWVVSQGEWVDAIDLEAGDVVRTASGSTLTVTGVAVSQADLTAYNLTIADLHTYHVGSSDVLVHNTGPDCGVPWGDGPGDVDFHGSEYTLDEYVEFVAGHTGDEHPTMGRPSRSQVEEALRGAAPRLLPGQKSSVFNHGGVRVIVNWEMPWKSTSYFPGS